MTHSVDRALSMIATRRFLWDLVNVTSVPQSLRLNAEVLLVRFPTALEVTDMALRSREINLPDTWFGPLLIGDDELRQDEYDELLRADMQIVIE